MSTPQSMYHTYPPADISQSAHNYVALYASYGQLASSLSWLHSRMEPTSPVLSPAIITACAECAVQVLHSSLSVEDLPQNTVVPPATFPFVSTENSIFLAGITGEKVTIASVALLAFFLHCDPVKACGYPQVNSHNIIDDALWMENIAFIQNIHRSLKQHGTREYHCGNPQYIFSWWPELGQLVHSYIHAAHKAIPIIISDCTTLLAGYLANELVSGVSNWFLIGTNSSYPIYKTGMHRMFLDYGIDIQCNLPSPQSGVFFRDILTSALRGVSTQQL